MANEGVKRFTHLSSSSLTSFVQRRSSWFAQRVLGKKITVSPAMLRGQAVETGVRFALLDGDISGATERALAQYDQDCAREGIIDLDGKVGKERDTIAPSVELAASALEQFGVPSYDDDGRQHKISLNCRYGLEEDEVIPIIGYLDFVFPELIVDLKSTGRMPSEMSWAHKVQRAIYQKATGKPVKFAYVTPKKIEIKEDGDIPDVLAGIKHVVKAMDRFLKLDEETQWLMALPDPDSYEWSGQETVRKSIFKV